MISKDRPDEFDPLTALPKGGFQMFIKPTRNNWQLRILLMFVFTLISRDLMALGPSSDDRLKFKELTEVKWLTCLFEPITTDTGEVLEFIGYHPEKKRTRLVTTLPEESELMGDLLKDEDSPFSKPMTLVFDDAKTKVKLVYPSILLSGDNVPDTSLIRVQEVAWLTPGALLLFIPATVYKSNMFLNLVVIPGKNAEDKFQAYMNFSYFGFILIVSAQCSDEADDDIRPELEKYRFEFQTVGTTSNQD